MKSRITISLFFLLFSVSALLSQTDWSRYEAIVDAKSTDPAELSTLITSPYDTKKEKVEAIYYWITHNIAYDLKLLEKRQKERAKTGGKPQRFTTAEIKAKREGEINDALRKKKGVCQHYAYTFQALCQNAGIPSEFIGGYSKNNPERPNSLGGPHAWNAVDWGEGWKLLDPTYGSGGGLNGKFVFEFTPGFFATDPAVFAMNHFPHEAEWQLLDPQISEEDYKAYTILGKAFYAQQIGSLQPQQHTIEFKQGEEVLIEFSSPQNISKLQCSNLRTQKQIECNLTKDGDNYQLSLPSERLRSGIYAFWYERRPLFFYKLQLR